MLKSLLSIGIIVLFTSCTSHHVMQPMTKTPHTNKANFAQEDYLILTALRAEQLKDYKSASTLFSILYDKTKKSEYIHRSLKNTLLLQDYEQIIKKIDKLIANDENDLTIRRIQIIALNGLTKLDSAKKLAIKLAQETQAINDYILLGDLLVQHKEYLLAYEYLQKVYTQDYDELILDRIVTIMYLYLNKKDEAIKKLQQHAQIHSCSQQVCLRLIMFYAKENNIDALLSTYLKFYELQKNEEVARKIVQIHLYKRQYIKLINFLEKSKSDNKTLLDLYSNAKNYKKAY